MFHLDQELKSHLTRNGLLVPLVRSEILTKQLNGVTLNPDDCERAFQAWCRRHGIASEDALKDYCRSQAMTMEDAQWQASMPLRIEQYALEKFGHRAEQRFLERKNTLDRIVYSLVRLRDWGLAQELYLRIAEGESSFADLAAEYSQGHEKSTRGIVGPIPLNQSHPRLVELLRSASAGQIFPPIQIENWWLVVRLEELLPAVFDIAMKSTMCRELFEVWLNDEVSKKTIHYQSIDSF